MDNDVSSSLLTVVFPYTVNFHPEYHSYVGNKHKRDRAFKDPIDNFLPLCELSSLKRKNWILGTTSTATVHAGGMHLLSPYHLTHSVWLTAPTCEAKIYCQVEMCSNILELSVAAGRCFFFFCLRFAKMCDRDVLSRELSWWKCSKSVTAEGWRHS